MGAMIDWWSRLWAGLRARGSVALPSGVVAGGAPVLAAGEAEAADAQADLLAWLLGSKPLRDGALDVAETQALARLDELLEAGRAPAELLPRAPAIVPQLLSLLRQGDASLGALSQRVAKDMMLTAEVLRQASSAAYRADGPVIDVEQALALLGTEGLRQVIARVVLRPLFGGHAGRLGALAAARLGAHAERQAQCAVALAAERGIDRFEAYLGALVHSTGWIVALRALDRCDAPPSLPFTRGFAQALLPRKDALFGKVVAPWQLTPALTELCAALARGDATPRPLGVVLAQSQRQAALQVLQAGAAPPSPAAPGLSVAAAAAPPPRWR